MRGNRDKTFMVRHDFDGYRARYRVYRTGYYSIYRVREEVHGR